MPLRLDARAPGFADAFAAFVAGKRELEADVDAAVAAILEDVRRRGDAALVDYTRKFDDPDFSAAMLRLSAQEIAAAAATVPPEQRDALAFAAARIDAYHRRQIPQDLDYTDPQGVRLGARWRPIAAVGLYVPGGSAAYPSSVLMNAIPAKVAGVERVAMVVPAPGGQINPLVLAAAELAGVGEIYRVGGAQAVGALAFGTATIAPVDKIVGPGNAYVAAAKRRVFGTVGIDMIAGPSEILVVADRANDPAWIAADLLSQAEHDAAAQAILITEDAAFADRVAQEVARQLQRTQRSAVAAASWEQHGAIILVPELAAAAPLVDRLAPEHLELALDDAAAAAFAATVRNAGAIFLGRYTPEAVGDYVGGPNHVLPTARSARFSSGLGVLDFMKRTTLLGCDAGSLGRVGPAAVALAQAEGLPAHAQSIQIRLNLPRG